MPFVADLARARVPRRRQRPAEADVLAAARLARAAALRGWMAAAWRMLAGNARAKDPARWSRETKIKNGEHLPMHLRHDQAYVVPHQID
ncbi:MAG TPA: hypothetical protein VKC57_00255 [Ktedonobacterales bacterium]|nr:hypothetical protein [Ktedonobacterales bacterium]